MEEKTCPICGGVPAELGKLGARVHARCRCCGMDFSWEEEIEDVDLTCHDWSEEPGV